METLDSIESAGLAPRGPDGKTGPDRKPGPGANIPKPRPDGPSADGDRSIARLEDELGALVDEISNDLAAINRDLSELVELRRGLDFDFERLEASLGLRRGVDPGEPPPSLTEPPRNGRTEWDAQDQRIALTMAVNGASREETARYLANNFDLSDDTRDRLLDHVYDCVDELRP